MKKEIAKVLGIIGAFASLFSGLFWYQSAVNQLFVSGEITAASTLMERFTFLANEQNLWAACCSAIAGIAIGLAVAFDD